VGVCASLKICPTGSNDLNVFGINESLLGEANLPFILQGWRHLINRQLQESREYSPRAQYILVEIFPNSSSNIPRARGEDYGKEIIAADAGLGLASVAQAHVAHTHTHTHERGHGGELHPPKLRVKALFLPPFVLGVLHESRPLPPAAHHPPPSALRATCARLPSSVLLKRPSRRGFIFSKN
jgi:hypothetical protein